MKGLSDNPTVAQRYAADFIKRLHLNDKAEQRCEWSCILWSKDHWAEQARNAKIDLHQAKQNLKSLPHSAKENDTLLKNSQFLNTVAQTYSKLFNIEQKSCAAKEFPNCPFMNERQDLLNQGSLANAFVTILHKASLYAMLDRHPLDSGLLDEEYKDVYGIDLTDFQDLERSLTDSRFEKLYASVVRRGAELAGLRSPSID
jgi:hypothetical protein